MDHQTKPLSDLVNSKKPALDLDALSALATLTVTTEKAETEREQLRQELSASIQHCENIQKALDLEREATSGLAQRSLEAESKRDKALAAITRVLTTLIVRPYAELPYATPEMTSREYEILQIVAEALGYTNAVSGKTS